MNDLIDFLLIKTRSNSIHWSYSEAKGVATIKDGLRIHIYNASAGKLEDYIIEVFDLDEDGDTKTLLEWFQIQECDPMINEIKEIYSAAKTYAHEDLVKRIKRSFE